MKKTLIALGLIAVVVIACQVNESDTTPEISDEAAEANASSLTGEIFTVVQQPASFPGGTQAWKDFLEENLIIPDGDPQGRVFVSFVTDTEGAIHDIQLIKGINAEADAAVVELLKKSPNWEAARQRGRLVNARMQVAVQFGEPTAQKQQTTTQKTAPQDMNEGFDEVFTVVEEQAAFPGGQQAWIQYLRDNLKPYAYDVEGRVFATFIVDKEGTLHNIQLVRGIGGGADEAVKELLENSPNWIAGKQRGKAVNTRMQVAVSFKKDK